MKPDEVLKKLFHISPGEVKPELYKEFEAVCDDRMDRMVDIITKAREYLASRNVNPYTDNPSVRTVSLLLDCSYYEGKSPDDEIRDIATAVAIGDQLIKNGIKFSFVMFGKDAGAGFIDPSKEPVADLVVDFTVTLLQKYAAKEPVADYTTAFVAAMGRSARYKMFNPDMMIIKANNMYSYDLKYIDQLNDVMHLYFPDTKVYIINKTGQNMDLSVMYQYFDKKRVQEVSSAASVMALIGEPIIADAPKQ